MKNFNGFNRGDLVERIKEDEASIWPEGTLGLLLEPVPSVAPIWRVLVGETGNVADWTAYNFVRAFDDERERRRYSGRRTRAPA